MNYLFTNFVVFYEKLAGMCTVAYHRKEGPSCD
jgi:hypothetical protein